MGISNEILPLILETGEQMGRLKYSWFSLRKKAKVYVAMGDCQCSCYSSLANNNTSGSAWKTYGNLKLI